MGNDLCFAFLLELSPGLGRVSGPFDNHGHGVTLMVILFQEMVVFRFQPKSGVDRILNGRNYVRVFRQLYEKGRYGVLLEHGPDVKDVYLVPIATNDTIPAQLLPFCGPGLEKHRQDVLLGVMWRKCRERSEKHVRRWTRTSKRARASMSPIDIDSALPPWTTNPPPVTHHRHHEHDPHKHEKHHHQPHHHEKPRKASNPDDDEPYDPAEGFGDDAQGNNQRMLKTLFFFMERL